MCHNALYKQQKISFQLPTHTIIMQLKKSEFDRHDTATKGFCRSDFISLFCIIHEDFCCP